MRTEKINIGEIPAILYCGDKAEETVLAVHGFGGSKESGTIAQLAQRICGRGFNILAFDLPAHGERNDLSELSVERCIDDIISCEEYIRSNLTDRISAFATSFGGYCMLLRQKSECGYNKTVLRVPAVDMADSLLKAAMFCDREFSIERAKTEGFTLTMAKTFHLPFSLYEQLKNNSVMEYCGRWNRDDIILICAENDELVSPDCTKRFLELNNRIKGYEIKGSGHRMMQEGALDKALDIAEEFLCDIDK